ncbi:polymorphic toxin-type HINT domain-containing protein [Streptomyces sp. YIM 130001]|uniref:polymorphic toxin-type HINT domain-containing protein n=1 Tax=Streptomyces sp. YIM 130001 TaxID=2259644 RepID=UPI0013C4AF55|nr:polymorphic toxin-type HINT domain-containing protein [Streptomyces sp. YIM 130001]
MTEYAGLLVIVSLVVVALFGTSINETVANTVSTKVCEVTGGDGCGDDGGGGAQADDGPYKGDGGNPGKADINPADDGNGNGDGQNKNAGDKNLSADEIAYNKSKSELDKALKKYDVTKKDLKKAAEELIKIAGEETGVTDALKCITEGDGSACTETVINALLMAAGGMPLKLVKKYLFNPKKGIETGKKIITNGTKIAKGLTSLYKQSKSLEKLKKKTAALKKKADAAKKKRTACKPKHSFLPGTSVLMADGHRIPIETVDTGDKVLATDPTTGRTAARQVLRTITTYDDRYFTKLTVATAAGAATITATDTHPFWLPRQSAWVDAGEINAGMSLRSLDGNSLGVTSVDRYTKRQVTYDLSVAGYRTYYVGIGSTESLVHNNDGDAAPIPQVDNPDLQKRVNALYHGVGSGRLVGDGTAMAAASAEANGAEKAEGKSHLNSTAEYRRGLNNFLTQDTKRVKGGKKIPVVRSEKDIEVAKTLIKAIDDAHAGRYGGHKKYRGIGGCE